MANQWKDISLLSYATFRWLLRQQNTDQVAILSESKTFLSSLGLTPKEQHSEYKESLLDMKEQLWDVFRANQEVFFVITKDKTTHTVNANELIQFLNEKNAEDMNPSWWPAHFATPAECDDWVDEKVKVMMEAYNK